jgi:hypothetical protein
VRVQFDGDADFNVQIQLENGQNLEVIYEANADPENLAGAVLEESVVDCAGQAL